MDYDLNFLNPGTFNSSQLFNQVGVDTKKMTFSLLLAILILIIIIVFIFEYAWNAVMPRTFGVGYISFWQALLLIIVARILFAHV